MATYPPNFTSLTRLISWSRMVFLARAHNVSESIVPDPIGTKLGIFPNSSSWKCDRDNLEKHKTTALNNSVNIFNLYSTIKVHQEAAHISQSKWSAFGAGESTFFGCDNIVSEMSASSTVVLFSVYTVITTGAGLEHVFSVIERTVFLSATFMIS